ncbi:MAG TPA: hemerythrin domain-containing protein [Streptosporangiaceae bacterium]|nr:hemerythrin domain-containing protein [Streptosporangiaceae bacterium]
MTAQWLTRRTGLVPTTPPALRLSTRDVLDSGNRPSAPEPDDDVTFSQRGLAVGQHLIDVHDHYRAELEQVRDLLARVAKGLTAAGEARGELNRLTIRANDWTLGGACQMQCVSLTEHHGTEDASIFPHLRQSQGNLRDVLDKLDTEHHAIHDVLEEIDAALIRLVQHPTDLRPVTEAIDLLTDTLLSHFAYEERELVGPLARHGFFPGQV